MKKFPTFGKFDNSFDDDMGMDMGPSFCHDNSPISMIAHSLGMPVSLLEPLIFSYAQDNGISFAEAIDDVLDNPDVLLKKGGRR